MKNKLQSLLWFLLLISGNLSAQTFTSSNLPIIVINTNGQDIQDEPKITADMGIINNTSGVHNQLTDPFNNYSGKIGIEIRGSTSQSFPKKQYGIEIRNDKGKSIDASLLGLPAKDDWVLFAPYNDKSLLRDALAYRISRAMGRYASRVKYCELVLNGNYEGIYILLEKVKRDKNRVDIAKLDPTEISGEDLTGGYIVKIDKFTGSGGGDGWSSEMPPNNRTADQTIFFQYDYPKSTDIVPAQKEYIKDYIDRFEVALNDPNFKDPINGYAKYIDVDSFIDFFIVNEVSKNVDGFRASTYLHKKKDADGGKIYMGPVWDFNLGFGNVNYCTNGDPEGFVYEFNTLCGDAELLIPFWWERLLKDPAFQSKLVNRWQTLRSGQQLRTSVVLDYIDSVSTVLNSQSQQRNFERWPVLGEYVWPNYYIGRTYQDEIDWLKSWVTQRLTWLDNNLLHITGIEPFETSSIFPNPSYGTLGLNITAKENGIIKLEILNLVGSIVNQRYFDITAGKNNLSVDLHEFAKGIYFCHLTFQGHTQTHRFVLNH